MAATVWQGNEYYSMAALVLAISTGVFALLTPVPSTGDHMPALPRYSGSWEILGGRWWGWVHACVSYKLWMYIWLLEALPDNFHWALPQEPAGGLPSRNPLSYFQVQTLATLLANSTCEVPCDTPNDSSWQPATTHLRVNTFSSVRY